MLGLVGTKFEIWPRIGQTFFGENHPLRLASVRKLTQSLQFDENNGINKDEKKKFGIFFVVGARNYLFGVIPSPSARSRTDKKRPNPVETCPDKNPQIEDFGNLALKGIVRGPISDDAV